MFSPTSGYIAGGAGRFYKTTNGTYWDTISMPTRSYNNNALDFLNSNVGFVVGTSGTGFYTTNAGTTWTVANTNGSTMNNVFTCSDSKAFSVGTSGYIFKSSTIISGVAGNEMEIPTSFRLDQNYPNPFNPTTTIKFAIPKASVVTMKIYDVAGREVMKLVNNQPMNPGVQTVTMNGTTLASGVYFYSLLVNGDLVDTKKMVLIK
jgi:hypothetical protein